MQDARHLAAREVDLCVTAGQAAGGQISALVSHSSKSPGGLTARIAT